MEDKKNMMIGKVVSAKMDKTVVVVVERTQKDPIVHKYVKKSKKYKVHDEANSAQVGDMVEFFEIPPKSKEKYMCLSRIMRSTKVNLI